MKILLHICCGVCAGAVAERLMIEGHEVTGFFYNPNIHPVDEYQKRLDTAKIVAQNTGFDIIEGPYDRENWFMAVKGKEYDAEGGARCAVCFEMRLAKTLEMMKKKNFDAFTTTLSVSPHKDAVMINDTGRALHETKFIVADFKKKGGFQRAMELGEEMRLYKQNYCGCIYSLEEKHKRDQKKKKDS